MPNNLLEKYLKLKGISYTQIASLIDCHISTVQKIVKCNTYPTKTGPKVRRSPLVENTIACCLQMPYEQIWGPKAHIYLKKAIQKELWKQFLINNNVTQAEG